MSSIEQKLKDLDTRQSKEFGQILSWIDMHESNDKWWRYGLLALSVLSILMGIFGIYLVR
jgi:hypothetical protein